MIFKVKKIKFIIDKANKSVIRLENMLLVLNRAKIKENFFSMEINIRYRIHFQTIEITKKASIFVLIS
jgi:plasmid maintenance system killer protein